MSEDSIVVQHVSVCHMDDAPAFSEMRETLRATHPGYAFDRCEIAGESELRPANGGVRVFWIYRGEGEVFVPEGFRTKEGDGRCLPASYRPEPIDPGFANVLATLRNGTNVMRADAQAAVDAILARQTGAAYAGDYANDLWKLEHVPRPWSGDATMEEAMTALWRYCDGAGYSRKLVGSFERIMEGDQLIASGGGPLRVRGNFACLTIEKLGVPPVPSSSVMRLRYLRDSAGGCNFDFDPFRRLPLTWRMQNPGERGDGGNFVNSHVVNIARETSPSHFHPPAATRGGMPQHEIYLVLDPAAYGLDTHGRRAQLYTWPDLRNLRSMISCDVAPGSLVHIPPGIGHRGIDVFVNVITIPGFKPHNEFYLDADLQRSGDSAVFNKDLVGLKNYDSLETFLR